MTRHRTQHTPRGAPPMRTHYTQPQPDRRFVHTAHGAVHRGGPTIHRTGPFTPRRLFVGTTGPTVLRGSAHHHTYHHDRPVLVTGPSRRASGLEVGLWSGFGLALVGALIAACLGPIGLMVAAGFAITALGLGIGALVVSARANSKAAATTSNLSGSEPEQAQGNSQPDLGEAARFTPSADAARAATAATAAAPAQANREEESADDELRASPATRL